MHRGENKLLDFFCVDGRGCLWNTPSKANLCFSWQIWRKAFIERHIHGKSSFLDASKAWKAKKQAYGSSQTFLLCLDALSWRKTKFFASSHEDHTSLLWITIFGREASYSRRKKMPSLQKIANTSKKKLLEAGYNSIHALFMDSPLCLMQEASNFNYKREGKHLSLGMSRLKTITIFGWSFCVQIVSSGW